jgi:hypothetical protein
MRAGEEAADGTLRGEHELVHLQSTGDGRLYVTQALTFAAIACSIAFDQGRDWKRASSTPFAHGETVQYWKRVRKLGRVITGITTD